MKQSTIRWLASFLIYLGAGLVGYGGWTLVSGEMFQASSVVLDEYLSDISVVSNYNGEIAKFITSDMVLSPVVEKLELDRPARVGSSAKSIPTVCEHLRQQIMVSPVRNTMSLRITVRDSSPEQAAEIANTIVEVYRDKPLERMKQEVEAGIRALEERLAQSLTEMNKASELLVRLRDELKVSYPEQESWSIRLQLTTNALPDDRARELRPFDEAKRDLEKRIVFKKILEQRLAMESVDQTLPRHGVVTIWNRAVPSAVPVFPSRSTSLSFLLFGIALSGLGWFTLRGNGSLVSKSAEAARTLSSRVVD